MDVFQIEHRRLRNKTRRLYEYETLEDLRPYKLGGVIGYFYEDLFNKAGLEVDYVSKKSG
jgi:polar amino acid transport system substrate-binding protein